MDIPPKHHQIPCLFAITFTWWPQVPKWRRPAAPKAISDFDPINSITHVMEHGIMVTNLLSNLIIQLRLSHLDLDPANAIQFNVSINMTYLSRVHIGDQQRNDQDGHLNDEADSLHQLQSTRGKTSSIEPPPTKPSQKPTRDRLIDPNGHTRLPLL